ncbi:MAG: iron ABC transporter permease [Chitinispirillia bacterium]|nr:iron ABC transporter permease [Chitinispirillia bacterium]MCL2268007.1 iron ABC transporter permease [Chitinispirillia bacterium]
MKSGWTGISILFILSIISLALLPFIGMETISVAQIFSDDLQREIFLSIRLPRVLTAFTAGASLALCGLVFQGVLRNPLADPFTLGIASGASFGAAITILTGAAGVAFGLPVTALGALCGAALSFMLVMAFSARVRSGSSNSILLAGIAVSFFFSSLLMFSQYVSSMRESFRIVRWLMGGVEVFGYGQLLTMLPFVVIGVALIIANVTALDHFLTGEDIAQTRGVRVRLSRSLLLAAASVMVGGIVSVCGPIGFVGLMIPHFCRSAFGAGHKILLPACLLAGGIFLTLCDTFARTVIAPTEIPVGVITALLGGPFLIWVLSRQEGR